MRGHSTLGVPKHRLDPSLTRLGKHYLDLETGSVLLWKEGTAATFFGLTCVELYQCPTPQYGYNVLVLYFLTRFSYRYEQLPSQFGCYSYSYIFLGLAHRLFGRVGRTHSAKACLGQYIVLLMSMAQKMRHHPYIPWALVFIITVTSSVLWWETCCNRRSTFW